MGLSVSQLEAEEAGLNQVISRAMTELDRLRARKVALQEDIRKLETGVTRLEAKGTRIVTLAEYRSMRQEALSLHRELARVELDIRSKNKDLEVTQRDLALLRDMLSGIRKLRS